MKFKVVVAGYNCYDKIESCLWSIARQTHKSYDVCVVDDASTDTRQQQIIKELCKEQGWDFIFNEKNLGAMESQFNCINRLAPSEDDVLVWVDLDDALMHEEVLSIVNSVYSDEDVLLTYGSYAPYPEDKNCPLAGHYPARCIASNDYRNAYKWGLQYNHLRTVSWKLFQHLNPDVDFKFGNGEFFPLAADAAVMIPCLELAGGRYKMIDEVLYRYTSDNPISEWRKSPRGTNKVHDYIFHLPRKNPII